MILTAKIIRKSTLTSQVVRQSLLTSNIVRKSLLAALIDMPEISSAVIPVLVPPIIIEDAVPTKIKIPYDIALDLTSIPAITAYVLSSGRTVSAVEVFELYVLLTVSSRYYWGDTETVAYTAPATNPIKSTSGGEAASFTATEVMNNITIASATTDLIAVGRYTDAPTDALKELINKTIVDYKAAGLFTKRDCFYIRGVHEALLASQNWIKNAHNSDLINNPTHTPKQGITGGTGKHIRNNYNPFSDAETFNINNSSMSFMTSILGTVDVKYILGLRKTSGTTYVSAVLFRLSANDSIYFNSYDSINPIIINIVAGDYITITKTETDIQCYINGESVGDPVTVNNATVFYNESMIELAVIINGTVTGNYNGQISFSSYGGYLTPEEVMSEYTIVKYFYDHVGETF